MTMMFPLWARALEVTIAVYTLFTDGGRKGAT